jgi:hypothetical protein
VKIETVGSGSGAKGCPVTNPSAGDLYSVKGGRERAASLTAEAGATHLLEVLEAR